MIVVLSLNTAIDRTLLVPGFVAGGMYRPEGVRVEAGGKGLNVARTLRRLGSAVRVIGFLGGTVAPLIEDRCRELEIEQRWVRTAGESRTCVIVADPARFEQSVINEPGPTITGAEVEALRHALTESTTNGDLLCLSGSAPPGVPEDFYAEIVTQCRGRGVRVLVDVSGTPLRLAWEAGPWAVKPNLAEYHAACTGSSGIDAWGPEAAVVHLTQHAEQALLTLGADGLLHAQAGELSEYRPPAIAAINAVGSGDALAAGFLAGVAAGWSLDAAIRQGIACGASNARRFEPAIGGADEIRDLAAGVRATHRWLGPAMPLPGTEGAGVSS